MLNVKRVTLKVRIWRFFHWLLKKEKINTKDEKGRVYYNLYIDSLGILQNIIDTVMSQYRLKSISRGTVDKSESIKQNRFRKRKNELFQEYH